MRPLQQWSTLDVVLDAACYGILLAVAAVLIWMAWDAVQPRSQ